MISLTAAHKAPFYNSNSLRARAVLLRKADMQLKDTQLFRQQAFIDGAWVDADNGQTIKVTNPATGEVLGTVPKMGAAETRRAIEAADKAKKEKDESEKKSKTAQDEAAASKSASGRTIRMCTCARRAG